MLGAAGLAVALVLTYIRLYFCVDLSDEGLWVALPYAYLLGHRPFIDEMAVYQGLGLITLPWVKLWVTVAGTHGLVLFTRHLWLAYACGVGYTLWRSLGDRVEPAVRLVLVALLITFYPSSHTNLSYTLAGAYGVQMGTLLLYWAQTSRHPGRLVALAVLFEVTAVFAYPPTALACLVSAGLGIYALSRQIERRHLLTWLAVTGVVLAAIGLSVVGYAGVENLSRILGGGAATGVLPFGSGRLRMNWAMVTTWWPAGLALLVSLWVCLRVETTWLAVLLVAVAVGASLAVSGYPFGPVLPLHIYLPLFTLVMLVRCPSDQRAAAAVVLVPGLVLGATMTVLATVGIVAGAIGSFVAGLFALASLSRQKPVMPLLICLLVAQLWASYHYTYHEDPIRRLSARVPVGPFAGLYTTPEKLANILQMAAGLERIAGQGKTIFFYDEFPCGYLFTQRKPHTPALQTSLRLFHQYDRTAILKEFERRGFPEVVVQMKRHLVTTQMMLVYPDTPDPLVSHFAEPRYARAVETADYIIWLKR